eukprot:2372914-Pyramimonas_sp.AAC.1
MGCILEGPTGRGAELGLWCSQTSSSRKCHSRVGVFSMAHAKFECPAYATVARRCERFLFDVSGNADEDSTERRPP